MSLLENIWGLTTIAIISIILLTNPKESSSGYGNSPLVGLFSSTSTGNKFISRLNWALILIFVLLTTVLSYIA